MKKLEDIVREIVTAGGFGDGIDTGSDHPLDILSLSDLSEDERFAASLSLLCWLAETVDNTTWRDAVHSAIARRMRQYLDSGGSVSPSCAPAVSQFGQGEELFWSALRDLYESVALICPER